MTVLQKISVGYFVALMIAASINYIPGLTDETGLAFGIFALDLYDDALHVASALWALVAGLLSHRASRMFRTHQVSLLKRLFKWLLGITLIGVVLLAGPIVYVETMCRGEAGEDAYQSILPQEHHRLEARTFMTYPEWHIVHAYDDYAQIISTGDPHDYRFLPSIAGYWSSLCELTKTAASHGGVDGSTKQLVYVIGASFSFELALKAAYEETFGRVATLIRGDARTPLDDLSGATGALRDRERRFALGLEYGAKASYAGVIASAVESTGQDQLTLRMIVTGIAPEQLAEIADVQVIESRPEGVEIETPRYRKLTHMMAEMAALGVRFVEIAGNDDILLTALSNQPSHPKAVFSFARQGYGDYRHLVPLKVAELSEVLTNMEDAGLSLEHIHDY